MGEAPTRSNPGRGFFDRKVKEEGDVMMMHVALMSAFAPFIDIMLRLFCGVIIILMLFSHPFHMSSSITLS